METDIMQLLAYGVAIIALASANAALLAFGLPKVELAYKAFWSVLATMFVPVLRRIFDRGSRLAKELEKHGIPAEAADQIAEWTADRIMDMAKPYLIEAIPPSEQ